MFLLNLVFFIDKMSWHYDPLYGLDLGTEKVYVKFSIRYIFL